MNRKAIAHKRKVDGNVQPLADHLTETMQIAGRFAQKIGMQKAGFLLGLMHDFGKYSSEFGAFPFTCW